MTSEQAFELMLQQHRERIRVALAGRERVTPKEVGIYLCPVRTYDADLAETLCGHLSALGFARQGNGDWVRV